MSIRDCSYSITYIHYTMQNSISWKFRAEIQDSTACNTLAEDGAAAIAGMFVNKVRSFYPLRKFLSCPDASYYNDVHSGDCIAARVSARRPLMYL